MGRGRRRWYYWVMWEQRFIIFIYWVCLIWWIREGRSHVYFCWEFSQNFCGK